MLDSGTLERFLGTAVTDEVPPPYVAVTVMTPYLTDSELIALVDKLRQFKCPTSLNIVEATITDERLAHVALVKSLARLRIDNAPITNAGLERISGLSNLTYLKLHKTHTTDAGLQHLAGLVHLGLLDLEGIEVTGPGFSNLAQSTELYDLYLSNSRVNSKGFSALAALPVCERCLSAMFRSTATRCPAAVVDPHSIPGLRSHSRDRQRPGISGAAAIAV